MKKNIPILKARLLSLIQELNLTPSEALQAIEPVAEKMRKDSRGEVEKDVNEFKRKHGIARIRTDY